MNLYLGIDFGTSGVRAIVINYDRQVEYEIKYPFASDQETNENLAIVWQKILFDVIKQIPLEIRQNIQAIAIDGTSATVLLCDRSGQPVSQPILYNDNRGEIYLEKLRAIAPADSPVLSASSSLAKLFWLASNICQAGNSYYFMHQADWLAYNLHGQIGISDLHNILKLGYDVANDQYPTWLTQVISNIKNTNNINLQLPTVLQPGQIIGKVTAAIAHKLNLSSDCYICAGTTDSIAAFLASGASLPGEAVTSLGSTLVIKLLSEYPVNSPEYGIYSHRLGNNWLVGGASNTGGAVLRHYFTEAELITLSEQIDPTQISNLDYYPLVKAGDRFPINDPQLLPRMTPRPASSVEFLHGLLTGIAKIEARGYQLLGELGGTPVQTIYTAGGGAKNHIWSAIRQYYLQVNMAEALHQQAAFGVALLAKSTGNF
jgi:xylulokinase